MIGIINIQWYDNPGAVWLAYSLQEIIKEIKNNESVIIIDYASGGGKEDKRRISRGVCIIYRMLQKARSIISVKDHHFRKKIALRHDRYEKFRGEYLQRTPRFTDLNSKILCEPYSACIVGSDVVWKPEIADGIHSKIYFLHFADKRIKKIAYAASIGTDDNEVLNSYCTLYQQLISGFTAISLRERTAVNFIQPLTRKEVHHVVDPVFLTSADKYSSLLTFAKKPLNEKYVYLYMLSYNEEIVSLALHMAQEKNLKIVYDLHTRENMILKKCFKEYGIASIDAGPIEFLKLIKDAEIVLSDSFHGTAFSIIFHKDFYTFGNINGGIDISTRMKDLLNSLSLTERYCKTRDVYSCKQIDYKAVDEKLNALREDSLNFLLDALKDV